MFKCWIGWLMHWQSQITILSSVDIITLTTWNCHYSKSHYCMFCCLLLAWSHCCNFWPLFFLQEKLNELYIYRDHYFETHSLDKANQKDSDVENEMKNTLKLFETLKGMYVWSVVFKMNCVLRNDNLCINLFVEFITVLMLQKMLSKRIKLCICTSKAGL
jgi:hypothetical protein